MFALEAIRTLQKRETLIVVYNGALTDRHLRAVIRIALRTHGFMVSRADFDSASATQWQLGCWLRDQAFPGRLGNHMDAGDYRLIAEIDPYLWNRLPLMAGIGFRHAAVINKLVLAATEADASVTLLGAAFNTAIGLLDYLVDECPAGATLFDVLNADVVRGIFEPTDDILVALVNAYQRVSDPRLRLLISLVTLCATVGRELHRRSSNDAAWATLGKTISQLFEAEFTTSLLASSSRGVFSYPIPALQAKSALPSAAMLQISLVASQPPTEVPALAQRASNTIGRIFWRIDDLVDLLADCRRGVPNSVVIRLADMIAERGRSWASETDIYDVVDDTARELVGLLRPSSFGFDGSDSLEGSATTQAQEIDRRRDAPSTTLTEVLNFARLIVAGWSAWYEDDVRCVSASDPEHSGLQTAYGRPALATKFLLAQQRDGYRDAIHHLHFPRAQWRYETHAALLSHRAVVLDALLDAFASGLPVPRMVLDAEALAILRAKHRDVRGGWNYIPEVPELPPDADDLGQVLQVLFRLGGPNLASTCDEAIRLALDGQEPDGGINTWILDPRGYSPTDEAILAYLPVMGGWGVHPEVVANLAYGLILYDPIRYQDPLLRASAYLEGAQDERGVWPSKWYAGPYYGTYRVATVIARVSPESSVLTRAWEFLVLDQHCDGSWGDAEGDPLSTSLALLALVALDRHVETQAVTRACDYLIRNQEDDGGWRACPWISFRTIDGVETYGSRTITTAFCLKALLATARMRTQEGDVHLLSNLCS